MFNIFIKIITMIAVIFIGYGFKKCGFFAKEDYKLIAKISLNLTLPASIISSFQNFQKDESLIFLFFIGIIFNIFFIFTGWQKSKNLSDDLKGVYIISGSGYNIGSFTLPFLNNLIGPYGVVATCMFDGGNAPFALGGSYAFASRVIKGENGSAFKDIILKLLMSPVFMTYTIMMTLSFAEIKLPNVINISASYIGSSNSFLSMLMMGMMFEIEFKREYFENAFRIIFRRYIISTIAAVIFYFLLPLPLRIKQILVTLMFAPTSGLAPIFIDKLKGNVGLAGFISSVSIIISTVIMSGLILIMGIK